MSTATRRRRDSEGSRPSRTAAIAYTHSPPSLPEFPDRPVLPLYHQGQSAFFKPARPLPRGRALVKVGRPLQQVVPFLYPHTQPVVSPSRRISSTRHLIGYWSADSQTPYRGRIPASIPPPHRSTVCERRAQRRSVIFAKGKTGKGSAAKRHHTMESRLTCTRR